MTGSDTNDALLQQFAQQLSAMSAAVHALLATVAVPETAETLREILQRHEADTVASVGSEAALDLPQESFRTLLAAADHGCRSTTSR